MASGAALEQLIHKYSKFHITRLALSKYAEFGRRRHTEDARAQSCAFVHSEGSVRLAHMISEMHSLPSFMLEQPLLRRVHSWYIDSFKDMMKVEPPSLKDGDSERYAKEVTTTVDRILQRHAPVVTVMGHGLKELYLKGQLSGIEDGITEFQNRFYMSRIGIRFLFNQHLALFGEDHPDRGNRWLGHIDAKCSVADIAEDAAHNAAFLCQQTYLAAPPFKIITPGRHNPHSITFTYVPAHLYHILFELLKNSFRAVVEQGRGEKGLPEVSLVIIKGAEDMTIKISDEGGGIPHRHIRDVFSYFYSTATPPQLIEDTPGTDMNTAPLAGLGYGLPLSRLYSRYFGGDLDLISIEGFGTDAYVYLRSTAENAVEVIPAYTKGELRYANAMEPGGGRSTHWMTAGK